MKIAKLETFHNEFVGFGRATTDSGDVGWGQVSTYYADITIEVFHRQIAPHALGTDALDWGRPIDAQAAVIVPLLTKTAPVLRGRRWHARPRGSIQ